MGHIVGPSNLIRADATQVGDLVVFSYQNARALGFVLEFNEDREALLAVLSSAFNIPRLMRVSDNELCMSYGKEWALVPVDSQAAAPTHFETGRRAGLLALTRNGWFMNFATSYIDQSGHFSWEWREMTTFEQVRQVETGIVFEQWKLWSSLADRDHPNRQPLMSYTAELQKGNQG